MDRIFYRFSIVARVQSLKITQKYTTEPREMNRICRHLYAADNFADLCESINWENPIW